MARYTRSVKIFPIALTLVAVAIVIAALVSMARVVFFSSDTNVQVINSKESLLSTSADRSVRMIVRGNIVADESFRSYQINISPNERTITVYTGYLGQVIKNISVSNNIPAYEQFVYALDKANFMKGNELTGDNNDLRGICATGRVTEFQMLKANESVKKLWTTSCANARGSLGANLDQISKLFIAQIPDYKSVVSNLW